MIQVVQDMSLQIIVYRSNVSKFSNQGFKKQTAINYDTSRGDDLCFDINVVIGTNITIYIPTCIIT